MQKYVVVPLAIGPFCDLDPLARIAMGLIWDRYKASRYNTLYTGVGNWVLPGGQIYCVYPQTELAMDIGCGERTARRCIADLRDAGCIDCTRAAYGGAYCITVRQHIRDYLSPQS